MTRVQDPDGMTERRDLGHVSETISARSLWPAPTPMFPELPGFALFQRGAGSCSGSSDAAWNFLRAGSLGSRSFPVRAVATRPANRRSPRPSTGAAPSASPGYTIAPIYRKTNATICPVSEGRSKPRDRDATRGTDGGSGNKVHSAGHSGAASNPPTERGSRLYSRKKSSSS